MFQLSDRYRYAKEILVFLLIMAALCACLVPAHRHIRNVFSSFESVLRETIRNETGLDISFDSASPNIFRNLVFHNVAVSSARDGTEIFRANRVTVSLRLLKLLRGDFFDCIRSVSVEGGFLALDAALAEGESESGAFSLAGPSAIDADGIVDSASSIARRFFASGLELNARNFAVQARVAGTELSVQIARAGVDINEETLSVDSDLSVTASLGEEGGLLSSLGADFSLSGELSSDFSSGFASLSIDSIGLGGLYLSRIGLVAGLQDGVISLTSMQEGQPLSLSMTLDNNSKSVEASVSCERLLLFRWLSASGSGSVSAALQNAAVSGSASLSWSEEEGLRYLADGNAELPAGLFGTSGGALSFDFSGDQSRVDIERLSLLGEDLDADFSGSFDFDTLLPDGLLSVRRFALSDGAFDFSGDFNVESSGKTASLSVPVLSINRAAFYGIEGSVDISSEGQYEFSLSADDDMGGFAFEGVFSRDTGSFLQLYGAFDSLSVENVAAALPRSILPDDSFASLSEALSPFALTTEVYCSTDFDRFSYNSPRLILASQEEGGLYFLASITGTESGMDITDISASPAGIPVSGNVYTMFEDEGGLLFSSDLSIAGIPYTLSGLYADGAVSAHGDYGLSFLFNLPGDSSAGGGSVFFSELPVQVGPAILSLSLDADFAKGGSGSWGGNINSFRAEEVTGLTLLNTVLAASGVFDSSGVSLRNISLSDEFSSLSGFASIGFMSDSISDTGRVSLDFNLSDSSGSESLSAAGSVIYGGGGNGDTLFEGQLSAQRLPLMRFTRGQQSDNFVSADISVSGSPDMMLASVSIPESSVRVGRSDMNVRARAMYEDGNVIVRDASVSWNNLRASNIHADFSTADLRGSAGTTLAGVLAGSSFYTDLQADFQGNAPASLEEEDGEMGAFGWIGAFGELARSFSAGFELSDIKWRDISVENPLRGSIDREPGVTALYAGENDELSGLLLDNGVFTASLIGDLPIQLQADGSASDGILDVDVSGVDIDMARLWPIVGWPIVAFDGGHVVGDFHIGGYVSDPDFDGVLNANDIVVRAPDYFPAAFDPSSFLFVADGKEIRAPLFTVAGNGGIFESEAVFYFNRWIPEEIDVFVRNIESTKTEIAVENKYVRGRGDGFCDINFTWTPDLMELSGDVGFENGNFAVRFENFGEDGESGEGGSNPYNVIVDLDIHFGRKVEFRWPSGTFPIMRALLQADEPFRYTYDSMNDTYTFKGTADLKGGDVFYFKRSFYLRDGSIVFDEREGKFDPRISLRAEVRERDENGSPVRITMTVDDDPLSSFNPVFTSDPLKNQIEIMEILGQVVTADTTADNNAWRDLAITGTDLLAQFGVLRPAENFIRDRLHLDIFSIRTLALQNAIFGNSTQSVSSSNRWSAGNFLDNTTVYIGKYIGSAVYVDALLQFSYYDSASYQERVYTNTFFPVVFGNLLVLPEIGIEFDTPFAHIRWGISPVPDNNNITLSWRFAY